LSTIVIFVVGIVIVFWGGYQGSKRFPLFGALVATLLLIGAWFLIRLDLRPSSLGDGAPSSAGAFLGLLLLLEIAAVLLAGTMLWAGWRGSDHPLAKTLFFFMFVPFAVYAVFANAPDLGARHPSPSVRNEVSHVQQGSKKDGYIWAIDSQFLSEDDCKSGTPEFLAGCREGVVTNRARHAE
jgi:hypothetical protein